MKRRDLLRYALGAPMAAYASACTTKPSAVPDGVLLDPGMALGHALRDTPPPAPADVRAPPERVPIVIAGGGVAGLACAWRLRRAGVSDFVVLDIDDELGGTARSGSSPVTAFPWGAHYITAPMHENRALVTLLDELGALEPHGEREDPRPREEHACRAPEERVFYRGTFYEGLYLHAGATDDDLAQLARFERVIGELAALVDESGARAFALPAARSSRSARFEGASVLDLDRESFASWLDRHGFTSWRLRWLCDYACRDDDGTTLDETSAWAGLFYFAARKRGRGDERPVLTWPEGNGRLVRHLAAALPRGVATSAASATACAVVNVVPRARGATLHERARRGASAPAADAPHAMANAPHDGGGGVDVVIRDRDGALRLLSCDHAVVAAPRFVAARITAPLRQSPPPWLARFTTSAWCVANIHLREHPATRGAPLAWDTVFVESPSLGYVRATHQRGPDVGPTVLTWYLPLVGDPRAARKKLLSLGRAEWAEVALAELAIAHPGVRDVVTRVDVCRWGHAMVRPTPGLFASGALDDAARPIGAVHFAHTDLSGMALFEEALFHGVRAAEEILASRGVASPSLL